MLRMFLDIIRPSIRPIIYYNLTNAAVSSAGDARSFGNSLEMLINFADQTILQIQPTRKSGVVVSCSKATQVLSIMTFVLSLCRRRTCEPQQIVRPAMNVPATCVHRHQPSRV